MIRAKATIPTTNPKSLVLGLLLAGVMSASLVLAAESARADTTYTVTNTNDSGSGSLRQVIELANDTPGADLIRFGIPDNPNVPGNEVKTIRPASELPTITEAVTIDGYSQPGSKPNTRPVGNDANLIIELDGTNTGSGATGLSIEADDVTVRGLIVNDFSNDGIDVRGNANKVEGNFVGLDATGTTKAGNDDGVFVAGGENNIVGGASPDKRNVISGNDRNGVRLQGSAPLFSINNKVQNNYIGTDKSGTAPLLGNGGAGVSVFQTPFNVIGGGAAEANVIAFNIQEGVAILATDNGGSTNNKILSNSIFSNGNLGIDLNADGPTANDEQDPDLGENGLQNFPVLESATASGRTTNIKGNLNSTPNKRFLIQFFSNPAGEDEGQTFLGEQVIDADESGDASFTFTASQGVPEGQIVTATATDRDLNTSEFSEPVVVEDSPPPENEAPVAAGDAFKAKKGKTLNVLAPGVLKNDSDPDGDELTVRLVSRPSKGKLTLKADGSFAYKPNVAKGTDSFTYRVSDGNGGTDTAKVTIKIVRK